MFRSSIDPEDEGTLLEPADPEDEGTLLEPADPEDEGTLLEPADPEDEGTLLEPADPEDEGTLLEPADPDAWSFTIAAKKRRRRARRRTYRRGRRGAGALWGDYPSGQPGNVRTSVEDEHSGSLVIRLAPEYAYADYWTLGDLAAGEGLSGLTQILEDYDLKDSPRNVPLLQDESWVEPGEELPESGGSGQETAQWQEEEGPYGTLRYLEKQAADQGLAPLHSLAAYWRADVAKITEGKQQRKLLRRLNKLPEVNRAYRELAVSDPSHGTDPFQGAQGYRDRAPFGINARWVEQTAGGPSEVGKGVKVVDLEQGWIEGHQDLGATAPVLIHGDNRHVHDGDYQGNHGTAVLGEIVAASNGDGVVGIAPGVDWLGLASHYLKADVDNKEPASNGHVADAIYAAIRPSGLAGPYLSAGDVLLIEVQRSFLPAEVDDADFDAIRLASGLGIIVVEAAGNGGRDLNAYRRDNSYRRGKKKRAAGARIFNRRSGGFRESGAIMVGAALSTLPHNRKRASNFGSRIDCFAWGNRVVTCGYGDLGGTVDERKYTADFTNTSAAAPIVAGAALALQGMYKAATTKTASPADGHHLLPGQMRALLADPATGTRQGRGVGGRIGVMPDLRAIATTSLGIVPDVYLRNDINDTGAVPVTRRPARSPDILVSQKKIGDYDEGTGTENSLTVGYKAVANKDNYVFVRMRNRGRRNAERVVASVYWSEAATLVTPDRWHEIGCSSVTSVPQGDTLKVARSIRWPASDVPEPGSYSLVALVEDTEDPTPLPPGLLVAEGLSKRRFKRQRRPSGVELPPPDFDWYAYLAYLRKHNNIAWRSLIVVDNLQTKQGAQSRLEFRITGTPAGDRGRFFDLEVLQRLPKGVELCLDVPMTLAPALSVGGSWKSKVVTKSNGGKYLRFPLPPIPRVPFFGVPLAAGAEHLCHFVLSGAESMRRKGNSLAIRQLFRGQEVGRVTWQFHK